MNYGGSFLVPATTVADSSINATIEVRLFAGANCTTFISGGSQGRTFLPALATATWFSATDNNLTAAVIQRPLPDGDRPSLGPSRP